MSGVGTLCERRHANTGARTNTYALTDARTQTHTHKQARTSIKTNIFEIFHPTIVLFCKRLKQFSGLLNARQIQERFDIILVRAFFQKCFAFVLMLITDKIFNSRLH